MHVDDIFSMAGLDKPEIGLLSDEFLEDVRRMKYKNLAVELLEKLLKDEIKSRTKSNIVHKIPFPLILTNPSPAMMTWSSTGMPRSLPDSAILFVRLMSALDSLACPDGWL